jgi:hypothetical protein
LSTFRKICRFLHREFGYFAVGLTLVYAISGVAVNHVHHWNPNYRLHSETFRLEPIPETDPEAIAATVLDRLGISDPVKNVWRPDRAHVQIFLEGATLEVDTGTGEVVWNGFAERPFLFDVNFLHLNHGKGAWTVIADAYSVLLAVLAITGIFLVKGRKGLAGRGGAWMVLGIVFPVVYLIFVRYL